MIDSIPSESGLQLACRAAGSQSALGRIIKRRQSTISDWIRDGKNLPAEYVPLVSRRLGIPREQLRPDLYVFDDVHQSSPIGRTVGEGGPVASCNRPAKLQVGEAVR